MTPWGVTTIKASCEARMPGARGRVAGPRGAGGLQGAEEARGGSKVQVCFSAGRGAGGVICYTRLSHPHLQKVLGH